MSHLQNMLALLPHLYRDGELVHGLMGVPAVEHEFLDEDARAVQRAHFFNALLNLDEAVNLAAVLDIPLEDWQTLQTYRAWVHALRNAMLRFGTVTVHAMTHFVGEYARGFQAAEALDLTPDTPTSPTGWLVIPEVDGDPALQEPLQSPESPYAWESSYRYDRPVLIENPPKRETQRVVNATGIEPLHQFSIDQRGLNDSLAGLLYVGVPGPQEFVPTLVNVTTGQALVYLGQVPVGKRLWIRPRPDGQIEALLESDDVSDRVYSVSNVEPGTAWQVDDAENPTQALRLNRGVNDLWFLPIAHYDAPGLDRVLLALADLDMRQGRFDQTSFDKSLFYQDPGVALFISWLETEPAAFEVRLPAHAMRRRVAAGENTPQRRNDALEQRDLLVSALNQGVHKMQGAGIKGSVSFQELAERQQQLDRLTMILPIKVREAGVTGSDQLVNAGGAFGVTDFNDSTYQ